MKKIIAITLTVTALIMLSCNTFKKGIYKPEDIHSYQPNKPSDITKINYKYTYINSPWLKYLEEYTQPIPNKFNETELKQLKIYTIPVPTKN